MRRAVPPRPGGPAGGNRVTQSIRKWAGYAGTGANAFFKALVGFGDYKVSRNSIMHPAQSISSQVPMMKNSPGGIIISHREYICDINSTVNFTTQSFPLQPGVGTLFPWLSSLAQNFEEYEFRGMVLEFKSMSSDLNTASTTSNLGTVVMCSQYNPLDPIFPDKRTMENYQFACSGKPSEHIVHPIECKRGQNVDTHLYVRTTASLGNDADLRLYDLGNFTIATQGMPAAFSGSSIGELWVSYEVEFYKPKLTSTTGTTNLADKITAVVTATSPYETSVVYDPNNSCGCLFQTFIVNGSTNNYSIVFPQQCHGRYMITYSISAVSTNSNSLPQPVPTYNSYSGTTILGTLTQFSTSSSQISNGFYTGVFQSATVKFFVDVTPSVNGGNSSIWFINGVGYSTSWNAYLDIVQVTPSYGSVAPSYS